MSSSEPLGRLVAVEGLDGAGKRTLVAGLTEALGKAGVSVAALAFPRYDEDIHAELAREALRGGLGDLAGSVDAMALLFALDRRAAIPRIRAARKGAGVVLIDRFVASNAAYSAARCGETARGPTVARIVALEIERFGVPVPDRQLLLDVDADLAGTRVRGREREHSERVRDAYERDAELQAGVAGIYRELAARSWLSPWTVLDASSEVDCERLAADLLAG
jgi:dTMP kinase